MFPGQVSVHEWQEGGGGVGPALGPVQAEEREGNTAPQHYSLSSLSHFPPLRHLLSDFHAQGRFALTKYSESIRSIAIVTLCPDETRIRSDLRPGAAGSVALYMWQAGGVELRLSKI